MKNYSSARASKGKVRFRTPRGFSAFKIKEVLKLKSSIFKRRKINVKH